MVPPLIRPDDTSIAPCQMIMMIALNSRKMTIAVISARTSMRRLAVVKTRSTASPKREVSRPCWLNAWTIFIAPSTSLVTVPTSAMRSWLWVEIARTRRPRMTIGRTINGTPSSSRPASLGASANRMMAQAVPMTRLRSATDTVVPTTCSMIVVSTVMRLVISAGRFSSKKPGDSRSRLR